MESSTTRAIPPAARRSPAFWIAAVGGVGLVPLAPGTAGSLVGIGLFVALAPLGIGLFSLAVAVLALLGFWACGRAGLVLAAEDDGRLVLDEVVGQLLALVPLVAVRGLPVAAVAETGGVAWIFLVVTGFVLFRGFDIAKPGPVRWAERNLAGGTGVMADDLVAGVLAALLLELSIYAFFGVSGLANAIGAVL